MSDLVRYEIKDGVAVVTIDNPPVNALSPAVWDGIDEAVARAIARSGGRSDRASSAQAPRSSPAPTSRSSTSLKTREDSLTRSAGTHALLQAYRGRGQAARRRDSRQRARRRARGRAGVPLPRRDEGREGGPAGSAARHHPGRGRHTAAAAAVRREDGARDVHRRQAGVRRPKRSPPASSITIVDGDLLTARSPSRNRKRRRTSIRKSREIALSRRRQRRARGVRGDAPVARRKRPEACKAPFAVVDAIEAGLKQPVRRRARCASASCSPTASSRPNRRRSATCSSPSARSRRCPTCPKDTPARDIKRAAVVGAGTMGGGIAMTYANAGIPVLLKEVDDAALQRGLATIRKNYEVTMSKGKMTAEQVEKTMALITPTTSYDGFDQVDIVVEAVFENMDLKKATFAELGKVTRPDCVLASNSSTLDIDEFARASGRPAQVIGHHFFSPANVMKLLEIVRGRETSKEVIATSLKLAKKTRQGRRRRRQLLRLRREPDARVLHARSVSAARGRRERRTDRSRADRVRPAGRTVRHAGHRRHRRRRADPQYLKSIGKTRAEGPQSAIPDRLFEMGRYGQKTGAGWYRYDAPGSRNRTPDPLIDQTRRGRSEEARHQAAADRRRGDRRANHDGAGQRRRARAGGRITPRAPATSTSSMSTASGSRGTRGGPMFYADTVGLRRSCRGSTNTARGSATTGSRRRCSSASSRKAAGFTANRRLCDRNIRRAGARFAHGRGNRRQRLARDHARAHPSVRRAHRRSQWIHVDAARAATESPFKTDDRARLPDLVAAQLADSRRDDVHRPAHGHQLRAQPRALRRARPVPAHACGRASRRRRSPTPATTCR